MQVAEDIMNIENNIPIPPDIRSGRFKKYPFRDMAIGDSFLMPLDGKTASQIINKLTASAYHFKIKPGGNPKFKTAMRTVEGGVRCWRIADAE